MDKKSFLNAERPLLTCMVQAQSPDRIRKLITAAKPEGADAFGMQFCRMKPEFKSPRTYRELFEFASPLPVYVTNYRKYENAGKTDEQLGEELVELADCGATLCDMMGDFYAPCAGEFTTEPAAVDRQKRLIEKLHRHGAEVLMSSHVLKFTPAERVLEIALGQQERGADICKIVVGAETMEEQIENLRILNLLRQELKIPFLFLSGGECRLLRRVGATMGSCMSLCVQEYDELATKSQPLLREMRLLRELLEVPK